MRTENEIKIKELEEALEEIDDEFKETLEDEEIDEFSEAGEELEAEFETKKEMVEKQVDILGWVLQ